MGVHSFWDIVGPTAKPVQLETLEDKKMAIDASIWIYQFLKAIRDNNGNSVKNSHINGFFRRICKLLYFGIKPVFVFDGGVPVLKRNTIKQRSERRQGKRENAKITARKLLAMQLHNKNMSNKDNMTTLGKATEKQSKIFKPQDDWDLPDIEGFYYNKDDQRINANYDKERNAKRLEFNSVDDFLDGLDLESINPASEEFQELPKAIQYQILSNLRLKSRLRMGYTKEQLQQVFPDSMDFSKFQIDMVRRRNFYTQKIINVTGINDGGASKLNDENGRNRISGQKNKAYQLTKTENGWTLGLNDQEGNDVKKAIVLDENHNNDVIKREKSDNKLDDIDGNENTEDDEDFQWEDVDLESKDKKKDNFDYSLKAGRLPQFEANGINIGSKAFLDSRPSEESPSKLRNRRYLSPKKEIFKVGELKRLQFEEIEDVDEDETDYLKQIEEIEVIEAMQKSKFEQNNKNKLRLLTPSINVQMTPFETQAHIGDKEEQKEDIIKPKNITNSVLEENTEGTEVNNDGKENKSHKEIQPKMSNGNQVEGYNTSKNKIDHVPLTEGEQNLNFVLSKLDNANAGSFLFGHTSTQPERKDINSSENSQPKNTIPKLPSWFQTDTTNNITDSYMKSAFVKDQEVNQDTNNAKDDKGYQLLTGFLNTQNALENNESKGNDEIKNFDGNDSVVNLDSDDEKEIEELAHEKNEKYDEISNESIHEIDAPAPDKLKPMVFNYEFDEEEEDNLKEDIRQEGLLFESFKNDQLQIPNIHNQKQAPPIEKAFMEDELYEQQIRDKRDSDEVTPEMLQDVQELLSRFGIPFVIAPMEAEAQCAELLRSKLVDGVITDDSDVFLFGASKVYKNIFQDKKYVEYYDISSIEANLGINREKMIELAMLLGSDYTTGIKGMGPVSSMEAIAEFKDLKAFKDWYEKGQFDLNLQSTEDKLRKDLRKKLVKNSIEFDENFPSALVREAYLSPEVDHDPTKFTWGYPDLDMLRDFLFMKLHWSQEQSDEVLLPLIKDINKRQASAKQRKLTDFFPQDFHANNKRMHFSSRIDKATEKLKKQKTNK